MEATVTSRNYLTEHGHFYKNGYLVPSEDMPSPFIPRTLNGFFALNMQKSSFKLHPCNKSTEISTCTHEHMNTDFFYPSKSKFFKAMVSFKDTEESFKRKQRVRLEFQKKAKGRT